jgi:hypothetical protein
MHAGSDCGEQSANFVEGQNGRDAFGTLRADGIDQRKRNFEGLVEKQQRREGLVLGTGGDVPAASRSLGAGAVVGGEFCILVKENPKEGRLTPAV